MKVVRGDQLEYKDPGVGHRGRGKVSEVASNVGDNGDIALKVLLVGEENTPTNFMFCLARQGEFYSPPHKHNFDQFRYAYRGDFSISRNSTLREGELGYFPEGTPYGPQDDAPGERELLVLQFGGASGQGYMSHEQMRSAADELRAVGNFINGHFFREQGEGKPRQDGFEALWEHHNMRSLEYPARRYKAPILLNPKSFEWLPANADGSIRTKTLGVFTERQTRAEMVRFEKAASHSFAAEPAIRLLFALSGSGKINDDEWAEQTAIQIDSHEICQIHADSPAELLVLVLPLLTEG